MAPNVSALVGYIVERDRVQQKKERDDPWPWTDDPVLQGWHFTCVRREDDRVTRWIAANWRDPHQGDPDLFFALAVARFVNWPDTLGELSYPVPWDAERFLAVMAAREARGEQRYTDAYVINAGSTRGRGRRLSAVLDGLQHLPQVPARGDVGGDLGR